MLFIIFNNTKICRLHSTRARFGPTKNLSGPGLSQREVGNAGDSRRMRESWQLCDLDTLFYSVGDRDAIPYIYLGTILLLVGLQLLIEKREGSKRFTDCKPSPNCQKGLSQAGG